MQNAQLIYLQTIEALLEDNEVEKALDTLLELDRQTQAGIKNDIIMQAGSFKQVSKMYRDRLISLDDYLRETARTRFGLLEVMKDIPQRLQNNAQIRSLGTFQFELPDNARLEKILGPQNNLLKINWLEKAMRSAKAVCRVVCEDGNLGTGFLTQDGYIFTNNHVISSKEIAKTARIEFNYEMDAQGNVKSRSSYQLDPTDFITSTPDQFDFARIRVIDRPNDPVSQWGYVEFDTSAIPSVGESVTIIQHPKGEDKQIALNANDVVSVWDRYVFYTTDTEPGSSGSPVFNKDWKVIAIHHAGKTDAEGGLQINARGDKKGANRGIMFSEIFKLIQGSGQSSHTSPSSKPTQGHESFATNDQPAAATTPQPAPPSPAPAPPAVSTPKWVVLYDVADDAHQKSLNKHLAVLKFTKKIKVYNLHADVKPGEELIQRATDEMNDAQLVICLVTANLFAAEEAFGLLMAARENGKTIVPVLIEKVDFEGTGLEKLKSLPSLGRSISDFTNADTAFADVVDNLKKTVLK